MKCKYCKDDATKGVIWADGRARIPVCDDHLQRAKDKVADNNDAVDKVETISRAVAELVTSAAIIVVGDLRQAILDAGQGVCSENSYINCRLFVQLTSKHSKLEKLPKVGTADDEDEYAALKKKLKVGDIIGWALGTHFAISLGRDEVLEVPEWGSYSKPDIRKLDDDEPFSVVYRPKWA